MKNERGKLILFWLSLCRLFSDRFKFFVRPPHFFPDRPNLKINKCECVCVCVCACACVCVCVCGHNLFASADQPISCKKKKKEENVKVESFLCHIGPVSLPHGPYLFARSLQFLCPMDRICSRGRFSLFAPWTVSVREVAPVYLPHGPYLFARSLQFICDSDHTSSRCNVAAVSP